MSINKPGQSHYEEKRELPSVCRNFQPFALFTFFEAFYPDHKKKKTSPLYNLVHPQFFFQILDPWFKGQPRNLKTLL